MSDLSKRWVHAVLRVVAGCCIAIAALACVPASAATLTWGTSGTGGTGTWSNANAWWNGTTQQTWSNSAPDDAVFAGTAGTVSVTTSATANSLTFNALSTNITISLSTGQTLAIGSGGITMNPPGNAAINGGNSYTAGTVTISGGSGVLLTASQSWINN